MRVELSQFAGACYGVQRALDMVEKLVAEGAQVTTLGPLIHNPQVVSKLDAQGVRVAEEVADVCTETVVIRSHGVTPQTKAALLARSLNVADATCPHVERAQKAAAELAEAGCRVLVVGEAGHPEVEGLVAYAREKGAAADVVLSVQDIPEDLYAPVGVVVQTTQTRDNLECIVEELKSRGIVPEVRNTICSATRKRQHTAAELANNVDVMIVLGGKNSSNTTRLAEICAATGTPTYHVESADELASINFSSCSVVGLTAGASTPEDQISEAVAVLQQIPGCV